MPRKGANIYKRKDGRWEGRYIKSRTSAGKAKYGYVYAKTYREVKEKLSKTAIDNLISDADSAMSAKCFAHIATKWYEAIKINVKESTSNKYRNLLHSYILPAFGGLPLCDITHDFIDEQCRCLLSTGGKKGAGLSAKTVTDILSVLRNILQFAIQKGERVPCDARMVKIKHTPGNMRVLSRYEQGKLCQYLYSNPNACNIGILMSLFTGLRVGEVCALRWEDISFSEQTVYVHQTLQRIQNHADEERKTKIILSTPKSTCSIRTIPLPDDLMKILIDYKSSVTGYVLTNSNQKFVEPRTMQNKLKRVLRECSIESANYHSLRHPYVKPKTKKFAYFSQFSFRLRNCSLSSLSAAAKNACSFSFSSGNRHPKVLPPILQ